MKLDKIEDIIEDIRQGKMVVLMDDEDRENETIPNNMVLISPFLSKPHTELPRVLPHPTERQLFWRQLQKMLNPRILPHPVMCFL